MTKITNSDTRVSREATIITKPGADLHWCIAVWAAPEYGFSKITGDGHGWQVVRLQSNGAYTYNNTMMGGFADDLDQVRERAVKRGYELLA